MGGLGPPLAPPTVWQGLGVVAAAGPLSVPQCLCVPPPLRVLTPPFCGTKSRRGGARQLLLCPRGPGGPLRPSPPAWGSSTGCKGLKHRPLTGCTRDGAGGLHVPRGGGPRKSCSRGAAPPTPPLRAAVPLKGGAAAGGGAGGDITRGREHLRRARLRTGTAPAGTGPAPPPQVCTGGTGPHTGIPPHRDPPRGSAGRTGTPGSLPGSLALHRDSRTGPGREARTGPRTGRDPPSLGAAPGQVPPHRNALLSRCPAAPPVPAQRGPAGAA